MSLPLVFPFCAGPKLVSSVRDVFATTSVVVNGCSHSSSVVPVPARLRNLHRRWLLHPRRCRRRRVVPLVPSLPKPLRRLCQRVRMLALAWPHRYLSAHLPNIFSVLFLLLIHPQCLLFYRRLLCPQGLLGHRALLSQGGPSSKGRRIWTT